MTCRDSGRRGGVTAIGRPNDSAAWLREITRRGQARLEGFFASSADPAYFWSVPVWAAVAPLSRGRWSRDSTTPCGAVPTPSANAPETQCDVAACVRQSCHRTGQVVNSVTHRLGGLLRYREAPRRRIGSMWTPNHRRASGPPSVDNAREVSVVWGGPATGADPIVLPRGRAGGPAVAQTSCAPTGMLCH